MPPATDLEAEVIELRRTVQVLAIGAACLSNRRPSLRRLLAYWARGYLASTRRVPEAERATAEAW